MKSPLALITACILIALMVASVKHFSPAKSPVSLQDVPLDQNLAHLDYQTDIKPIIEQRCVVCHACYDAPCQLKLGSYAGLKRGANKTRVYDGERLIEANLTRLFEDAHSTQAWRDLDFFPVIADSSESVDSNLNASVMAKMLLQKQQAPLPKQSLLPDSFELDLNRDYQCASNAEYQDFQSDYPLWGMPYGLPKLSETQHKKLINWIAFGAKNSAAQPLSADLLLAIEKWEAFLNQDSNKAQLMSRYLFEHLFLVHLFFEQSQTQQFFKLVRSATPPGQPIQGIYTRRPFDDPKVQRVYYRLQAVTQSIAHKSHMPMQLSAERMQRWHSWFIEPEFAVTSLPSYHPKQASNPFITFAQIPLKSRYAYMLDEAQNTIMQFIKGPVCRGQLALNVINDHFWVFFADPDLPLVENNDQFMQQARSKIALPAEEQSNALPTSWLAYAAKEKAYLKAKSAFIKKHIKNKLAVDLNLLWDGNGDNDNAALTIFRHNDAATVVKGLVGEQPQTAWVLTYPLFERIHYLLVAGYDVYGNVGHQLNSRMYMDFLRMEGEFNFLSFLPLEQRKKIRDNWYRGSVSEVEKYVYEANQVQVPSNIHYQTDTPLAELYKKLQEHFKPVSSQTHQLSAAFTAEPVLAQLQQINQIKGAGLALLPHSAIVRIQHQQQSHFYTLLRHSAHSNISHLFAEQSRRLPEEDGLTLAPNLMTSHPNAFFSVDSTELEDFKQKISKLNTEQDYTKLKDAFGVRRTDDNFWQFADQMHDYFYQTQPREFGLLDFNRLENR